MSGYELIVAPLADPTFLGGIVKQHRGREFRVEFRASGTVCTKNGEPIAWEKMPHEIRKAAHAGAAQLKAARGVVD